MSSQKYMDLENAFGAMNYNPLPVVLERGKGVWVWDSEGNKYMDMLSSYSALNQGHTHPKIIQALTEQAQKLTLTSRAFYNNRLGAFLEKLCTTVGMEKALPMNSGAEGVETALKCARRWGYMKKGIPENKAEIIVCNNNFHGRTISIISFSTEADYKKGFGPFTPGFVTIPFNDASALEKAITKNTAAFLVEPIQGEAGVYVPDEGYLKKAYDMCKKNNVLFIADEIQTGFGRTGKLFACQHENIQPDMFIFGKALGGGVFPVSAIVTSAEVASVFTPGSHGSTFGGNPLAAAIGLTAIEIILEEKLVENSYEMGAMLMKKLKTLKNPHIKEVRGKGLLIGLELKTHNKTARQYCEDLQKENILCKETHESIIRFAPPLVINKDEVSWAFERIQKVIG